jgi:hypothetical protein
MLTSQRMSKIRRFFREIIFIYFRDVSIGSLYSMFIIGLNSRCGGSINAVSLFDCQSELNFMSAHLNLFHKFSFLYIIQFINTTFSMPILV